MGVIEDGEVFSVLWHIVLHVRFCLRILVVAVWGEEEEEEERSEGKTCS